MLAVRSLSSLLHGPRVEFALISGLAALGLWSKPEGSVWWVGWNEPPGSTWVTLREQQDDQSICNRQYISLRNVLITP